jgi:hypothetical protein
VRKHLATFLAHTEATYAAPLPRYVRDGFERYLSCGDFSRGFVRCHCDGCGHDVLVALSCKGRGLCPSCNARRMANEAAVITDRILPNAPVRQWVLSLPFELRRLAATKPDVLTALGRIFAEEIARTTRRIADAAGSATGAVSFPQRFGGSLNLHVHFHTLALDGVFVKRDDGVCFHETRPPDKAEVDEVARRVHDRAVRWLRRHGYLDERPLEERGNEPPEATPIDGFSRIALAGGTFLARPFAPKERVDESLERKPGRFAASHNGFDVHCAVRIAEGDDEGRERLVRYCARPPFALARIEELKDGRISYLMKTPRRARTHRVMTPVEFMARLAILIPPPYFPLVRYHGVFAARSSWRALVTPKPPERVSRNKPKPCNDPPAPSPPPVPRPSPKAASANAPNAPSLQPPGPADLAPVTPTPTPKPQAQAHVLSILGAVGVFATLTVKHWHRLLDGALFATSSRVDWAVLMQRTFGFDALRCPKCAHKMRILATITEPATVRTILDHLGVRADPLPRAPARDPTGQTGFDFDAA